MAGYIKEHRATVTVFYISNLEDYLGATWDAYLHNIAALPTGRSSLLIRFIARQTVINPMSDVPAVWPGQRGNGQPRRP